MRIFHPHRGSRLWLGLSLLSIAAVPWLAASPANPASRVGLSSGATNDLREFSRGKSASCDAIVTTIGRLAADDEAALEVPLLAMRLTASRADADDTTLWADLFAARLVAMHLPERTRSGLAAAFPRCQYELMRPASDPKSALNVPATVRFALDMAAVGGPGDTLP